MIIVTGASGQLGAAVLERLLQRVPSDQVGVSVRDPESVPDLTASGVRVRRGDYGDPSSLEHAFEGASQVLVVSSNSSGETAVAHHAAAIEAAKQAGAHRVIYTSHMGARADSAFAPMRDHAATEAVLRTCGLAFTVLRNGFYASSGAMLLGGALQTGELVAPEDGPVSWTAHADLADVAVAALVSPPETPLLDGVTAALTGSESIDLVRTAELASQLSGRAIRRVVLSDEAYRSSLLSHGLPEASADMLLGIFLASRTGDFALVDPTLADLVGHPPVPFEDVLAQAVVPTR